MSQVGRKTTIILDEDMYRLILGYAVDTTVRLEPYRGSSTTYSRTVQL